MPVSSSHLPQRGHLEGLPRLELSLGERPVLLHRPVHDDDLKSAALPAHDQSAGRLDHICRGRELGRHRSSRHCPAGYRRTTARSAAISGRPGDRIGCPL